MNTKRFLLMLLVALMSVTGAWAQYRKITKTYYSNELNSESLYNGEIQFSLTTGNGLFKLSITKGIDYVASISFSNVSTVDQSPYYTFNGINLIIRHPGPEELYINGSYDIRNNFVIIIHLQIPHDHSNDGVWVRSDDNQHYKPCTTVDITGESCEEEIAEDHDYSSDYSEGASFYTCSECGYVSETRRQMHVHDVSTEWSSDANQHWHACVNTTGICDHNNKFDVANHTYGADGVAYYTCTVCNYINTTRQNQYELNLYKQQKAEALQELATGIVSVSIDNKIADGVAAINAATSIANVDTAYGNAVAALQPLIATYNDGINQAKAEFTPTGAGMRMKVTKKDNKVYEFKTQDVKSVDYYRANE